METLYQGNLKTSDTSSYRTYEEWKLDLPVEHKARR